MSLSEIFKQAHGNFNEHNLVPLTMFDGKFETKLGLQPSNHHVEILKEKVPHLIEHIYFIRGAILTHFCYYHNGVYIDVNSIEWEHWEMFKQKERIEHWKKDLEEALEKKDYEHFFGFMEKKILIDEYLNRFEDIPKKLRYEIFRDLWRRSEYGFEKFHVDFLEHVFEFKRHSKSYIEAHNKLREELKGAKKVTIYRGITDKSTPLNDAVSWTLDEKVAEMFATRFNKTSTMKRIYKATVDVNVIEDYLYERSEKEVLVLPFYIQESELYKTF